MHYVLIKRLAELTGLSQHAIRAYVKKGEWREGIIWCRAPNGRLWFNLAAVDSWVEGKVR